jgi:hypothetical protein
VDICDRSYKLSEDFLGGFNGEGAGAQYVVVQLIAYLTVNLTGLNAGYQLYLDNIPALAKPNSPSQ